MTPSPAAGVAPPEVEQLVRVRDRYWFVAGVRASAVPGRHLGRQHLVELVSVDEGGLSDRLGVIWEVEPGVEVLEAGTLPKPNPDGFDPPERLEAFLDAVRWGAVTSADSRTLQSPFRSGITIEDYQLEPLVRALSMPRVNLLIADDTGLGKTIEAGLVAQELLLRHRAHSMMVLCPPTLMTKWQQEMRDKFGLHFEIIDSARLRDIQRARGKGINPLTAYPRVIVSYAWLKLDRQMRRFVNPLLPDTPTYPRKFDLLIVDEVHQCAPSGRGRYAVDTLVTNLIRTLSPHFEHRLFLSATPHNGYTEAWTALLELLDPQRFQRGVEPGAAALERTLVRRLKAHLRDELPPDEDGLRRFPVRHLKAIEVDYPDHEREIHALLETYRQLRDARLGKERGGRGRASDFITLLLKKRLFSSPAAFASTLNVHLQSLREGPGSERDFEAALGLLDSDLADDQLEVATDDVLVAAVRRQGELTNDELDVLNQMVAWADRYGDRQDAKADRLIEFLIDTCTEGKDGGDWIWNDERVLIFTEYTTTQGFLQQALTAHGFGGNRLEILRGGMDGKQRDQIIGEFQRDPSRYPVRIILATDTASEGLDLQRQCKHLVNVEIPFSPTKLEQRAGRIDRHGQPSPDVYIHHFVGTGFEDAEPGSLEGDLQFLNLVARKMETIRDDLGSAANVLAAEVEQAMLGRRSRISADAEMRSGRAELTKADRDISDEIERLRVALDTSRQDLRLGPDNVHRAVATALELARQPTLEPVTLPRPTSDRRPTGPAFRIPALNRGWARAGAGYVDDLTGEELPITFDERVARNAQDVSLAHLGSRLVVQSLDLLRSEIWASPGRAGGLHRVSWRIVLDNEIDEAAVVAYARLVVAGQGGARIHEELIAHGGYVRLEGAPFSRLASLGEVDRIERLEGRFDAGNAGVGQWIAERWDAIESPLYRTLEVRAEERTESLLRRLEERRDAEIDTVRSVLTELQRSMQARVDEIEGRAEGQLTLEFDPQETAQFERDLEAIRARLAQIPAEIDAEAAEIRRRFEAPRPLLFPAAVSFRIPQSVADRLAKGALP